jgi:putative phage-type endonuclease
VTAVIAEAPAATGRKVTPTGVLVAASGLPEAEWLQLRRSGIGGSDVAALLGMSRYTSPFELYLDKRGELPDLPRSPELARAAYWGHRHEAEIAEAFAEIHGLKVRRVGLLRHETEPWRLANLDRQVYGCPDGPCLLECKSRSAYKAHEWGPSGDPNGVPDDEALQTNWYLGVTGYGHAHVGVLINGNDDRYYRIDRDPSLEADVTALARGFWQRTVDGNPPPVDGSQAVTELLASLWAGREGAEKVIGPDEVNPLKAELKRAQEAAKEAERQVADAKNQMALLLGDAEAAVWDGQVLFTRKQNGTFAEKRFAEAHPELHAKYTRTVDVFDPKALAADNPELYRAFRARVLRVPGGSK